MEYEHFPSILSNYVIANQFLDLHEIVHAGISANGAYSSGFKPITHQVFCLIIFRNMLVMVMQLKYTHVRCSGALRLVMLASLDFEVCLIR